jgi:site-specific recombinase XerD
MARGERIYVTRPVKHGNRWRITITDHRGGKRARTRESFPSQAEADVFRDEILAAQEGETVSAALDRYLEHVIAEGCTESTERTLRNSIGRIADHLPVKVKQVTPGRCASAYAELVAKGYAADTHQNSLRDVGAMWRWLGGRDPWEDVKPIGERVKGKEQLTIDESARFTDAALAIDNRGSTAALLCLYLALRAGEIVALVGRDVDAGGRMLWVQRGKTKNARRVMEVPPMLQRQLVNLARSAGHEGRLFPFSRGWVGWQVRAVCEAANVRQVPPHGLRGTHATIAADAGTTAQVVAAALGHGGPQVTREHYIAPGAEESAQARRVADRLGHSAVSTRPSETQAPPTMRN